MADLILGAVGAFFAPAGFAALGFSIGSSIGGLLGGSGKDTKQEGPRLTDLKVQVSTYGVMIPICFGTPRLTGNVIWSTPLKETRHKKKVSGGKGGKGGSSTIITYTYSVSFAVGIAEGEVPMLLRTWANSNVIFAKKLPPGVFFYNGDETQTPSPVIESILGAGNVPGYRGLCYLVFQDLQVEAYGNRIPTLSFEILGTTTGLPPAIVKDYSGAVLANNFDQSGTIPSVRIGSNGLMHVGNVNLNTGEARVLNDTAPVPVNFSFGTRACYVGNYTPSFSTNTNLSNNIAQFSNPLNTSGKPKLLNQIWVISYSAEGNNQPYLVFDAATGQDLTDYRFNAPDVFTDILYDESISRVLIMRANPVRQNAIYVIDPAASIVTDSTNGIFSTILGGALNGGLQVQETRRVEAILPVDAFGNETGRFFVYNDYIVAWTGASTYGLIVYNKRNYGLVYSGGITGIGVGGCCFADSKRNQIIYFTRKDIQPGDFLLTRLSLTGLTLSTATIPNTFGGDLGSWGFYNATSDRYLVLINKAAGMTQMVSFDPDDNSLSYVSAEVNTSNPLDVATVFRPFYLFNAVDLGNGYAVVSSIGKNSYWLPLDPVGSELLSNIVRKLCLRCGYTENDIDVTQLTDVVDGYKISRIGSVRSAIEELRTAYFFDGVESNNKIKFVKRGGVSTATITADEMGVYEYGQEKPNLLTIVRAQEMDLPREVNITYQDNTIDQNENTQKSQRMTGFGTSVETVDLAIVMNPTKAKQVADVVLFDKWSSRTNFEIALSRDYSKLEPTDIIDFVYNGNVQFVRIVDKQEGRNGLIQFKAAFEDIAIYQQSGAGAGTGLAPDGVVIEIPNSIGSYLDINAIRDQDSLSSGFYFYAKTVLNNYRAAVLYQSIDDGATFGSVDLVPETPPMGLILNTMPDWQGGNYFDTLSYIDVLMKQGALESVTSLSVLNGDSFALVGNELVQFMNAELIGVNKYRVSKFLRGRRGTEHFINSHTAQEQFVLVDIDSWIRVPTATAHLGLNLIYKTVTAGAIVADAGLEEFTNTGKSDECYAPVHIKGGIDASGNLNLQWIRRTRFNGDWRDQVDVFLAEVTEKYEVDILNYKLQVIRTAANLLTQSYQYTAANIATDFPTGLPNPLLINVYQLSNLVGRGYAGRGVIYSGNSPIYGESTKWRIVFIENNGSGFLQVNELKMFDEYLDFENKCKAGSALTNGGNPQNAFDDVDSTLWSIVFNPNDYLQYDFDRIRKVTGYSITASSTVLAAPKAWQLQYRKVGWVTMHEVTGQTAWAANETRTFIF